MEAGRSKRALSLLIVVGNLQTGGTENHLSQVLPALAKRGNNITVYCLGSLGPPGFAIASAGITIIDGSRSSRRFVGVPRPLRGFLTLLDQTLSLASTIRKVRPDICNGFLPQACIVSGFATLLSRKVVFVASRRSLNHYQKGHRLLTLIEGFVMRRAKTVVGNSRAVVNQIVEEGISPDRATLIYNGIDLRPFESAPSRAQVRERECLAENAYVIVVIANLIPYKGHHDLLAALSIAASQLPHPWFALCVGRDEGIQATLLEQANGLGIKDNIRFLGERSDVPSLCRAADVSVLCSHQEGFSNAVLEAMASGLPAVVTNVGGNAEAVVDGETGRVVQVGDAEALATAILEFALNQPLRVRTGLAARSRAKSNFNLESCVDRYELLYQNLRAGTDTPVGNSTSESPLPS